MEGFQLSLPLMPASIDELYIDQAPSCDDIYDRRISCFYTPVGIKKMDSDYCRRIRACGKSPETVKEGILKNEAILKEMWLELKQKTFKEIQTRSGTIILNDYQIDREIKRLEEKTREHLRYVGEDPEKLRDEILCNPHLHACIKENLLNNLDRILQEKLTEA